MIFRFRNVACRERGEILPQLVEKSQKLDRRRYFASTGLFPAPKPASKCRMEQRLKMLCSRISAVVITRHMIQLLLVYHRLLSHVNDEL